MGRWMLKTDIPLYYPDKELPHYDEAELKELVQKYLSDPSYRNTVIESQMRLTLTIASMYVSKYTSSTDELVSDALFALVSAVDRFRFAAIESGETNLSGYINRTVWKELQAAVLTNKLIPIPPSVLSRKLRDGTLKRMDIVSLLGSDGTYQPAIGPDHSADEADFLNVVINCNEKRRILRMRVAKYSGQEIADELRVNVSYVWNRCREIRQSLQLRIE